MPQSDWVKAHPEWRRAYKKKWYRKNQDKERGYRNKSRQKLKREVFTYYSNASLPQCVCIGDDCWHEGRCRVTDLRVLSIDHIKGEGHKLRKIQGTGFTFWYWLRAHNYPKGFQTMCMNCQFAKRGKEEKGGHPIGYSSGFVYGTPIEKIREHPNEA